MVSNGTDNMVMPVAPMYGGYNGCNGNGFGWGGDWAWIILLLLLGGNGWGNGFGGGYGADGVMPYLWNQQTQNDVNRGYDEDYSMARMPYGRSYDDRMSREGNRSYGDNSYARGRDAMGRYVSRDDSRHDLIEHLRTMMDNARTPEERESYRNAIDHMNRN